MRFLNTDFEMAVSFLVASTTAQYFKWTYKTDFPLGLLLILQKNYEIAMLNKNDLYI